MENISIEINEESLTRFQKNLKVLRFSKMLTSAELSKELGISKNRAWDLETGRVTPGIKDLHKIAEYFKIFFIRDLLTKEFLIKLEIN
ncbi:hypothetical protein MYP_678 [Sporocytophaga myxococcoides]|uniref:HTH cro/C1-type domain-containing protein n=1 Tax=Sporocytophaga myxococcoides TaxID=153721 RepID=A0A098L983_9BACT|nr:helix-turn-helix transcriptional regulator [Sporocytophaga myxococcoides]GAL83451.1 hypothetical protein MYP_678 [Sporocytophaga myxococcoides]